MPLITQRTFPIQHIWSCEWTPADHQLVISNQSSTALDERSKTRENRHFRFICARLSYQLWLTYVSVYVAGLPCSLPINKNIAHVPHSRGNNLIRKPNAFFFDNTYLDKNTFWCWLFYKKKYFCELWRGELRDYYVSRLHSERSRRQSDMILILLRHCRQFTTFQFTKKKTFAAQKLIIKWSLIALRSALYIRLIWDFSLDGNVWYVSRSDIFACSRLSAFQYQKEFQFENGFWYGWIVFLAGRSVIVAWWRFFRLEFANIISVLSNHRTACESPTVCVCVCWWTKSAIIKLHFLYFTQQKQKPIKIKQNWIISSSRRLVEWEKKVAVSAGKAPREKSEKQQKVIIK